MVTVSSNRRCKQARKDAKAKNKWLLVNIQREDEFACHTLNRSVNLNIVYLIDRLIYDSCALLSYVYL